MPTCSDAEAEYLHTHHSVHTDQTASARIWQVLPLTPETPRKGPSRSSVRLVDPDPACCLCCQSQSTLDSSLAAQALSLSHVNSCSRSCGMSSPISVRGGEIALLSEKNKAPHHASRTTPTTGDTRGCALGRGLFLGTAEIQTAVSNSHHVLVDISYINISSPQKRGQLHI
jgi:hypothetical protein